MKSTKLYFLVEITANGRRLADITDDEERGELLAEIGMRRRIGERLAKVTADTFFSDDGLVYDDEDDFVRHVVDDVKGDIADLGAIYETKVVLIAGGTINAQLPGVF